MADISKITLPNGSDYNFKDTVARGKTPEWGAITDVTVSNVVYKTFWQIAPTSSNQVYGVAVHPTTGQLYRVYNNKGTYSVSNFMQGAVSYVNGYDNYCPSGTYLKAGAAITAGRIGFQGLDSYIYMLTNTTAPVLPETKVLYLPTAISANGTIANTNARYRTHITLSSALSGLTVPSSYAAGDILYAQFHSDENHKLYSDATVVKDDGRIVGKHYYYLGHCYNATTMELMDSGFIRLYTGYGNGYDPL